jgi:hypothetical protein
MYRFKQPETREEFDQLFRLNHEVFAGELGQYATSASGRLVDKFHAKNRYVIALEGERVVGMAALHAEPPYSVAGKLPDPRVLDGLGRVAEIRLLAIHPGYRKGALLRGLLLAVFAHAREFDTVVISGRVEEQRMYSALGFNPLGPPVPSGEAEFVPMAARVSVLASHADRARRPPASGSSTVP